MMRRIIANLLISLDGVVEEPEDWHFPAGIDRLAAMAAGHPGHPPVAGARRGPAETAADPQAPPYPAGATGLHTISVRVVPALMPAVAVPTQPRRSPVSRSAGTVSSAGVAASVRPTFEGIACLSPTREGAPAIMALLKMQRQVCTAVPMLWTLRAGLGNLSSRPPIRHGRRRFLAKTLGGCRTLRAVDGCRGPIGVRHNPLCDAIVAVVGHPVHFGTGERPAA
jgi:hypothetical protein